MDVEEGTIKLISKDNETYEVPRKVALMSNLVKQTIEDDDAEEDDEPQSIEIPILNVPGVVLSKVIEYCKHYQEDKMRTIATPLQSNKLEDLVQEWYTEFVKVDKNMLFNLVAAANFMDIKELLDLTCLAVSILIKGKPASELRAMFNITSEYTNEENAEIAQGNQWVAEEAGAAAEEKASNNED